ncbi:MAG: hypothetical protein ACC652_16065, partial [Acidimicrobiales bacterium]
KQPSKSSPELEAVIAATGDTRPSTAKAVMTDEEKAELREQTAHEPDLFVLNHTGPLTNSTAPEPLQTFKLAFNPSIEQMRAMDVTVDWDAPKALGPDHRMIVSPMKAGESKRFDFEIDPGVESWTEFDLFVEVEFWLAGDFRHEEHYWSGEVTIVNHRRSPDPA